MKSFVNGNSLKRNELCLTYVTTVNELSTNSIQIQQQHWYGSNIYVVSCISNLSATSGKVKNAHVTYIGGREFVVCLS